jgi:hypothetical protein
MHSYLHKNFILVKSGCYNQHAPCTSMADALRPPRDDEAESELELETPLGKSPPSLILNQNDLES